MHAVVLQGANHFQARAITHVRETRIFVPAEMSLENAAVFGAIEYSTPSLELAYAIGRFLGVQLRHSPLIHVLPAAHGVGEMHFPVVPLIDVRERSGNPAFRPNRVRLTSQR